MFRTLFFIGILSLLLGCGEQVTTSTSSRILLLGDSMMAFNRIGRQSVANVMEDELREEVIDRSVSGARYFYILPISGRAGLKLTSQYVPGKWEWVVMNGGGNDLLFGCGCGKCAGHLDRMVSTDGKRGEIPEFVARMRAAGSKVIYVGYMRNPGTPTPIRACRAAGDELDRRLSIMAGLDPGVTFLAMSDVVPFGDASYHQFDRIHPTPKASRAIARRITALMTR